MAESSRPARGALAAAAALLVAAAWPGGPLAFLPPLLRWPLVLGGLAAGWRAARAPDRPPPLRLDGVLAGLVLVTFALLKLPGLRASWSDDNVYFYLAVRAAAGELPYRDFFFAHPPVHLAVPALVFRVAGFSVGLAKALPVLAQGLAGLLLWRALRRGSRLQALAALALHLTAYQVLMGASDLDGENLATAFLAAGLAAAAAARPGLAGALAGLAVGTVLYATAGAGALAVACALGGRRAALRFAGGLSAALAAVFVGGWLAGGRAFLDAVFGFHAAKLPSAGRAAVLSSGGLAAAAGGWLQNLALDLGGPAAWRAAALHAPVLVAALLGALALGAAAWRAGRLGLRAEVAPGTPGWGALVGLCGVALFAAQGAALPERYPFYDVPAYPFLAALGGYAAWRAWQGLSGLAGPVPARPASRWALGGLALFAAHPALGAAAQARTFPEEGRHRGEVVAYPWRDPDALAGLAQVSRALFWSTQRVRGTPEPGWRQAMWNKALAFSTAGEIAAHVRAGSAPGETLTGASTLAPLVALLAGRRMAAGEVDTNQKRFTTGSLGDDDLLARALADRVRYVLAAPRSHFTEALLESDPRWSARFVRERVFEDPWLSRAGPVRLVLYRRR